MSLMRYRADFPAVILVLAVMLAQLSIFFLVDSHWMALGLAALLLTVQVSSGAICHNHHHVNTFRVRWLNRLFESVMYLQTGTSPFSWTLHHNIGHHRHYLDQDKDPASWKEPDGRLMNRIKFDVVNAARIYPEIIRIGRSHPTLYRRFKMMFVLANLPLLVFALIDPLRTLIVFIGPMVLLLLVLLDNTYGQHAGTETDNHYVASRNVELPLYNLTSWNLGYHTAHHLLPGLHWSKLPELHQQIRGRIPEELIVNTMLLQWEPGRQRRQQESS
ncbi:fatty acid desaturase [Alcanivorax sp. 1008]|uniref:fatty acid desaturase family protein n=1 Tax=Alcanivorax sp. 1008 TaxID=2816853 RepID=UPI001E3783CE|nr:fatty acid desaturase [Alcanivorax sp. 1008]